MSVVSVSVGQSEDTERAAQAEQAGLTGGNSCWCQFVHDPRAGHSPITDRPELVRKLLRVYYLI